ncbi:hypothetical protein NIES4073_12340 [Kalymmatonema gypsitolerans NIES-4073]|nr:hypothetical protein NIES4073_12340 [Scytonema sp. NIES-4073]
MKATCNDFCSLLFEKNCIFIAIKNSVILPKNTKISLNRSYHVRLYNRQEVRSEECASSFPRKQGLKSLLQTSFTMGKSANMILQNHIKFTHGYSPLGQHEQSECTVISLII